MRHSKTINHLGRKSLHRKAMLANMAVSLIIHKRITTTTAKAKALKTYIEPLITKSKDDSTHSRRVVFSYLQDKDAVSELFRDISPKIADRPGGYTRILKTGNRIGDNAEMCILELVDYNEAMLGGTDTGKTRTRRRRTGKKKTESVSKAAKSAGTAPLAAAVNTKGDSAPPAEEEKVKTEVTDVANSTEEAEKPVEESTEEKDNKEEDK